MQKPPKFRGFLCIGQQSVEANAMQMQCKGKGKGKGKAKARQERLLLKYIQVADENFACCG
jgi:hypothetical protein